MSKAFGGFYAGRRVLVTGHTGFKGAWLSLWLHDLGARVFGLALDPPTDPNFFEIIRREVFEREQADRREDIRDMAALIATIEQLQPDTIFHLAAQSLVRESYAEPLTTFQTNALGTANLLEAVRRCGTPCNVIIVTSDKCYKNREWEFAYRENDSLGGHDVYSMSKAAAEFVANAWRRSFFSAQDSPIRVATARAGNVIGGGDYARDRIVPDSVFALSQGQPIPVRNPQATRPWQHVLECLSGYLCLGARLGSADNAQLESAFNFGPGAASNRTVAALVTEFLRHWPGGAWKNVQSGSAPHEASRLNLATDKAASLLNWFPVWDFQETVRRTAEWYDASIDSGAKSRGMLEFSRRQLAEYTSAAAAKQLSWAAGG